MENAATKIVPGPNRYDMQNVSALLKTAPSFGFGTSKRPQSHNTRIVAPGPGAYAIKGLVGSGSTGKTLGLKLKANISSAAYVPGPGTYHASGEIALKKAPSWRIGSSKRD